MFMDTERERKSHSVLVDSIQFNSSDDWNEELRANGRKERWKSCKLKAMMITLINELFILV